MNVSMLVFSVKLWLAEVALKVCKLERNEVMSEINCNFNLPGLDPSGRPVVAMAVEFQDCPRGFEALLRLRLIRTIEGQNDLLFLLNEI